MNKGMILKDRDYKINGLKKYEERKEKEIVLEVGEKQELLEDLLNLEDKFQYAYKPLSKLIDDLQEELKEEIIKKEEINGEVYVCLKDLYKFLEQAENGSDDLVGELQLAICENRYLFDDDDDEEEEGE